MSGSVGAVKIPIISTFDASGVQQAKAGLKDLQQSQGAGGGAGGGGFGPAPSRPSQAQPSASVDRLGISAAGKTLAARSGLGGIVGAMGAAGPAAAVVAAGTAVFSLTQKIAGQAIATRDNARGLGVSIQYYTGLASAARRAGTDVSTATQSLSGLHDIARGALTGDIGEAIFLKSLGIGKDDLQAGFGDTERLARRFAAAAGTPGQKAALFGSVTAANAIANANGPSSFFAPTAGEALSTSSMAVGAEGLQTRIGAAIHDLFASIGHPGGLPGYQAAQDQKAIAQQGDESTGKLYRERQLKGAASLGSILPAREAESWQADMRKDFIYSGNPHEQERYQGLAAVQAQQQLAQTLAPVRSIGENLAANIDIAQRKFEANKAWSKNGEFIRPLDQTTGAQQDAARELGSQVQDYAERMTHAGGLAGAYDVNTAAGSSQMIAAEEGMRQSSDAQRLVQAILEALKQQSPANAQLYEQAGKNLGYQFGTFDFLNLAGRR